MHLNRTADNLALHKELTTCQSAIDISATIDITLEPRYQLLRVDQREASASPELEIALISKSHSAVVYYTRLEIANLYRRTVVQRVTWRSYDSQHAAALQGIAQHVLINYLANHFDVIISDDPSTGSGESYWLRHMSNALACGLHIYHCKKDGDELKALPSQNALNELKELLFTSRRENNPNFALISKVPLSTLARQS